MKNDLRNMFTRFEYVCSNNENAIILTPVDISDIDLENLKKYLESLKERKP